MVERLPCYGNSLMVKNTSMQGANPCLCNTNMREWRNGRRAGFRNRSLMGCGFKSHFTHQGIVVLNAHTGTRLARPILEFGSLNCSLVTLRCLVKSSPVQEEQKMSFYREEFLGTFLSSS